jgi:chromosome segregation ATPase
MNRAPFLLPFVFASLLSALPPVVRAQSGGGSKATAPSIVLPPSAAPKAGAQRTLSGKAGGGKLMSREELRTCLKRVDTINATGKDLEQRRASLDAEKADHVQAMDGLKAERADVDAKLAAVREWEGRVRTHSAEIESFNQRLKAAAEGNPSRSQREAQAKEFDAERDRLNAMRDKLAEEEARLVPTYQQAVKAHNERALARDGKTGDWNTRNKALNDQATQHELDRGEWMAECSNRPYREDDEIAIKSGK